MQGPVTYDLVTIVIGAILLAFAGWWRIETAVASRIKPVADKLKELEGDSGTDRRNATDQAILNATELKDFKVYCANTFVPMGTLSAVESRLTGSIDRVANRVEHVDQRVGRVPAETVELLKTVFDGKPRP